MKAGQRVTHPNILPFLGICDNPDPEYKDLFGIVLPFCANGNAWGYLLDHPQAGRLHIVRHCSSGRVSLVDAP